MPCELWEVFLMELRSGLWIVKMQHAGERTSECFDASDYTYYTFWAFTTTFLRKTPQQDFPIRKHVRRLEALNYTMTLWRTLEEPFFFFFSLGCIKYWDGYIKRNNSEFVPHIRSVLERFTGQNIEPVFGVKHSWGCFRSPSVSPHDEPWKNSG